MFNNSRASGFMRLMSFMKPRWLAYSVGLVGTSLAQTAIYVLAAFILKTFVDAAILADLHRLKRAVLTITLELIIVCAVAPIVNYLLNASLRRTIGEIRERVFDHIQGLPMSYYDTHHSGELVSIANNDIYLMESAYASQLLGIVRFLVTGLACAVIMLDLNVWIGALAIALGLISTYINTCFASPLREISQKIQSSLAVYTERLSDLLAGNQVIKMFRAGNWIIAQYREAAKAVTRASMAKTGKEALIGGINEIIRFASFAGLLAVCGFMMFRGKIEFGSVVAILQLQEGVTGMFMYLGGLIVQLQGSLAAADRVFGLLDEMREPERYHAYPAAVSSHAMLELRDLSFSYQNGQKALDGLSLSVPEGWVAALVGPSGGGKTTIFKLLMGFYGADSGNIFINGKSIGEYALTELRDMISYVPQDTYLFSGTIAENIAYGRPGASLEEIIKAAQAANAHEFIVQLPEGYNTLVGERGAKLSGGQRQRIAIARAILKDAPILLLDEATSSLDSESERLVQEALKSLMKGKTTLVIAHRLSTIENADIIYVIDEGKVVEQGKHRELLDENGLYKHLYDLQFRDGRDETLPSDECQDGIAGGVLPT